MPLPIFRRMIAHENQVSCQHSPCQRPERSEIRFNLLEEIGGLWVTVNQPGSQVVQTRKKSGAFLRLPAAKIGDLGKADAEAEGDLCRAANERFQANARV